MQTFLELEYIILNRNEHKGFSESQKFWNSLLFRDLRNRYGPFFGLYKFFSISFHKTRPFNKEIILKNIKTELNLLCKDLTEDYLKKRISLGEFFEKASQELLYDYRARLVSRTEEIIEHHNKELMELPLKKGQDFSYYLSETYDCEFFNFSQKFGYTKMDLIRYFLEQVFTLLGICFFIFAFGLVLLIQRYSKFRRPLKEIEQSLKEGKIPEKSGYTELDMMIEAIENYVENQKKLLETQKLIEAQMAKQEKLAALGTMAGGFAHEFNNLLQMILTSLELAKVHLQKNQTEEALKHLSQIERVSKRGQNLASRILFISKPTPGESTQICQVLKELKPLFRSLIPRDIEFSLDIDLQCPCIVNLSEEATKEILLNLIKNSVDALEGPIKKGRNKEIRLTLKSVEHYALLEVSDTGCGLSEEQKKRIFEPFYTTKGPQKGTGLGLYMVYNLVQSAGGKIEVESAPGEGTTFRIYLPLVKTELKKEEKALTEEEKREEIPFKKVLLVDDEEDIRETLKEFLEFKKLEVHTAPNGKVALEKLLSESFDLLLVDMYMPEMDGLTLVKEAEKALQNLPFIIIMTGFAGELTDELKDLLERKVVKRVLRKPFSLMDLEKILQAS